MATRQGGRRSRVTGETREVELANLPDPENTGAGILIAPEIPAPRSTTDERRERELEDILSELGNDARIRVYQIVNGQSSFAGEVSAEGFSLEMLLETFGGGEKSLTIMQGKSVREKTKVWLDPSVPPKNPRAPKNNAPNGGGSPGIMDMTQLIGAMATQSMGMVNMMNAMMTASQQSTAAMMTAMTQAMAAGKSDPMPMILEVAKILKGGGGGGDTAEVIKMFREGLSLGKEITGGDGDDDGTLGIVREGMGLLGTIVQGIVADKERRRLAPGVGAPIADVPAPVAMPEPATEHQPQPTTTTSAMRPWVQAAAPYMGKLITAASFLTPRAAADTLAERLTQEQFDDLMTDVFDADGGGFGVRLTQYFPELRASFGDPATAEFIGKVLQVLIDEYTDDDEGDDAEPGAPANGAGAAP